MAKFYDRLTTELQNFIEAQHIFFVASAPNDGRVNLSPKGMDALRVINESEIAYLDLTGSGNETAAHLLENSRITVMLCSFTEKPLILRLYGQGQRNKVKKVSINIGKKTISKALMACPLDFWNDVTYAFGRCGEGFAPVTSTRNPVNSLVLRKS